MPDRSGKYLDFEAAEGDGSLEFLSKSRVKQWLQNPEHFRLKYLEGYVEQENAAMDRGTRIHESIEHYYEQAMEQYDELGLPPGDYVDYLKDDRTQWAPFLDEITNFFQWEHARLEHSPDLKTWLPISIEEEHWRHDTVGLPLEGTTDLIVNEASLPYDFPGNGDTVIVDFKSGKTPKEQYRSPAGIYTELAFYELLFMDKYDIAGSAALYLKQNDFVIRPDDDKHVDLVHEALDEMNDAIENYDGGHFETNEGPLCCWGTEPDQRSKFYGICPCSWAVPVDNEERFRALCSSGLGNQVIADELGTTRDAVSYWRYKLDL